MIKLRSISKKSLILFAVPLLFGGCSLLPAPEAPKEVRTAPAVIGNVCGYFPKEMVESAVLKPIVRVEPGGPGQAICRYYTEYYQAEADSPEAVPSSGRSILVSYETVDPGMLRQETKTEGNSWQRSLLIPVDNMIIRRAGGAIHQIYLFADIDRVVRLQYQNEAIDGKVLLKLAAALAGRL